MFARQTVTHAQASAKIPLSSEGHPFKLNQVDFWCPIDKGPLPLEVADRGAVETSLNLAG
jgi:hypothetical protein